MKPINPTITQAGLKALFNAHNDGVAARITHIAIGDGRYTPSGAETALRSERTRIPVLGGKELDVNIIEVVAQLDQGPELAICELGLILEDGTLLAVWSQPDTMLAYYTTGTKIALSFLLSITQMPPGSLQVSSDMDMTLFFAEEFAGLTTAIGSGTYRDITLLEKIKELQRQFEEQQTASLIMLASHANIITRQLQMV